jgi:predicted pyridoxine 5'-phosphate oxidase superfamily flavin-nucleotide-binding protein
LPKGFINFVQNNSLVMGLLSQDVREFVNKTKLGFIATIWPDGTPNLSPKGTTIAWDEDHLAFADIYSPSTISNLLSNPSIEINVVDVFSRKGYRFKGSAEVLSSGEVFELALSHYMKASDLYKINNIVMVRVNEIRDLYSPIYDHLSEPEITSKWTDYWESIHPKNAVLPHDELAFLYERDILKMSEEIKLFKNEENLWKTSGSIKNSCGNLALHIIGGLNHFMGATLLKTGYVRNRDQEFAQKGIARNNLVAELEKLVPMIHKTINQLTREQMGSPFPIFFDKENATTRYVLTQLLLHLNYHLGQVNYLRRSLE